MAEHKPLPRRTLFAVTLQLGRARPSLLALLLATGDGDPFAAASAAKTIARCILSGARDRSPEPFQRTVNDAQCRTTPLTRTRRRPRRKRRLRQAVERKETV